MRPIHLALLTLIVMYAATTGLGAVLFTTGFGRDQLQIFMDAHRVPFEAMTTLGSPLYWVLLLSLAVITPIVALVTELAAVHFVAERTPVDIPTWMPIAISAILVAWCSYKLAEGGALIPYDLLDRSVDFSEKMQRRVELMNLLGNQYYGFAYSSLPVIASFLLAKGILQKDRLAFGAFWILSAIMVWLDIVILMKAPIIIYVGLVALTMILSGYGWIRSLAITAPIAIVIFYSLSLVQFSARELTEREISRPATPPAAQAAEVPDPSYRGKPPLDANRAVTLVRNATLRMASSFPYYVQAFADPSERCGLELPPIGPLPRKKCFAPIKVFHLMYPNISYVTGFAPAPANVSAYAELGLGYSFVVTIICGAIIGVLAFLARGRGPLAVSLGTAACIYVYYVTQVSLTASLIDSYGLLYLLLPIVAMALIGRFFGRPVQR